MSRGYQPQGPDNPNALPPGVEDPRTFFFESPTAYNPMPVGVGYQNHTGGPYPPFDVVDRTGQTIKAINDGKPLILWKTDGWEMAYVHHCLFKPGDRFIVERKDRLSFMTFADLLKITIGVIDQ